MSRKVFSKSDLFMISIILLAALLIFLVWVFLNRSVGALEAVVTVNGSTVETVNLSKNHVFSVQENPNIIFEVKDGAIAFTNSDCPDKLCVHTGFIKHSGQLAACLPNNVVLKIVAKGKPNPNDADVST